MPSGVASSDVRPSEALESPRDGGEAPRHGNYERSSIGRAPVSKTGGWGFDSLRSCCLARGVRGGRTWPGGSSEDDSRRFSREPVTASEAAGRAETLTTGAIRPPGSTDEPEWVRPRPETSRESRCHGQSQRRSVGVETVEARQGGSPARAPRGLLVQFLVNLTRTDLYKPHAGLVRPALHGPGTGRDRGRRRLAGSTRRRSSTRRSGGSGCPRRLRGRSWAG